jgi:hypothetical protein
MTHPRLIDGVKRQVPSQKNRVKIEGEMGIVGCRKDAGRSNRGIAELGLFKSFGSMHR